MQALHEAMCKPLAASLSARLRNLVQVSVVKVEQSTLEEYLRQTAEGYVLSLVEMEPLPGAMLVGMSLDTALALIDRLLGGRGQTLEQVRPLTEIEVALVRRLVAGLVEGIAEGWRGVAEVKPLLVETAVSPRNAQVTFATDAVLLPTMDVKIGDTVGTLTFCLSHRLLEPAMPALTSRQASTQSTTAAPGDVPTVGRPLRNVGIPVRAYLGGVTVPVRDVMELRVGDVLRLDSILGSEIRLLVGGRPRFTGRPGLRNGHLAVQVMTSLGDDGSPLAQ